MKFPAPGWIIRTPPSHKSSESTESRDLVALRPQYPLKINFNCKIRNLLWQPISLNKWSKSKRFKCLNNPQPNLKVISRISLVYSTLMLKGQVSSFQEWMCTKWLPCSKWISKIPQLSHSSRNKSPKPLLSSRLRGVLDHCRIQSKSNLPKKKNKYKNKRKSHLVLSVRSANAMKSHKAGAQ